MLLSTWGPDFLFQLSSENNVDVYIDIIIKLFMVLILAGTVQSAGSRKGVISSYPVLLRFDFFFKHRVFNKINVPCSLHFANVSWFHRSEEWRLPSQ